MALSNRYEEQKLSPTCKVASCGKPKADDSDFCASCRDDERKRVKLAMRAVRKRKRAKKRCLWCPKKAMPGRPACLRCQIRRDRMKSSGVTKRVTTASDRFDAVTEGDGRTRIRYRGKAYDGKAARGRQGNAELDSQDLVEVRRLVQRTIDALAMARSPESQLLPPIQRRGGVLEALGHAHLAQRMLGSVLERNDFGEAASKRKSDE